MSKDREQQISQAMELEREVVNALQKVRAYDASIAQLKRNIQKGNITLKEIASVDQQKTFAPIGKCFVFRSQQDLTDELTTQMKQYQSDIEDYEKLKQHLIVKGKEKELQLQEALRLLKI